MTIKNMILSFVAESKPVNTPRCQKASAVFMSYKYTKPLLILYALSPTTVFKLRLASVPRLGVLG